MTIASRATNIYQLVGDYDREFREPTMNLTSQRYGLPAIDEGAVFMHNGRHYLLFGETWGPCSEPMTIFEPWNDLGYCYFMHTNWNYSICDSVHDTGREYEWGGEYQLYRYAGLISCNDTSTAIYFNMSTWNPYTVVLMKATLSTTERIEE